MIVAIRYGGDHYNLDLPEKNLEAVIQPNRAPALDLKRALKNNRLPEKLLFGSLRILIIINDAFRGTPSYLLLDEILPILLDKHEVRILVSTGLHPQPTETELRSLIGGYFEHIPRKNITWSDCRDLRSFTKVGTWSDGGEVYLHNDFFNADAVIVIGSVEPHYFAGFTGGIKSLVPGISYYRTIEHNHCQAISPASLPGAMVGNPVWDQLWSTLKMIDESRIFSYQIVQDSARNIIGLFSGGLAASHRQAIDLCQGVFFHYLPNDFDMVIAEHSPPLDRNLYQLQKCFENTNAALKDGGALLMFSACQEGIGTRYFYDLAAKYPDPDELLKQEQIGFDLGIHKLYRTAILTKRANLYLMSSLADEVVRRVYINPVGDANEFIKNRLSANPDLRIILVKDAGHSVIRPLE